MLGLQQQLPKDPSLPKGTTHEGLVQLILTRPTPLRLRTGWFKLKIWLIVKPDMANFKADSVFPTCKFFASQFKDSSGSKGDSSQDQAQEISQDRDLEQDHADPPEGEEGELASEEEDPDLHQEDPNLPQLVMTEEEQRNLIPPIKPLRAFPRKY